MQRSNVTNNNLMNTIDDIGAYMLDEKDVPEELFIRFINELAVSNLIIPGVIEDDSLSFDVLSSDDDTMNVMPLFSDDEAFARSYGEDSEFNPLPNDFRLYCDILSENDLDGIIINHEGEEFILEKDIVMNLPLPMSVEIQDDSEGYGPEQLLNIAESVSNDSMIELFEREEVDFEELMLELQKATLLNLVVSEEDLSLLARDGAVSREDAGEFVMCTTGDDESQFGVLFTGRDAIIQGLEGDSDYHYLYQIALLDEFFEFVLKSDMDGIIINPGSNDYILDREVLLEAYCGITYDNPKFKQAMDYAFIL